VAGAGFNPAKHPTVTIGQQTNRARDGALDPKKTNRLRRNHRGLFLHTGPGFKANQNLEPAKAGSTLPVRP
jgi:hypothetical protein